MSWNTAFAEPGGQIIFLTSHSFSKMGIAYSFPFHSCHTSDNRKLIEDIRQLNRLSASDLWNVVTLSDVWRSRNFLGFLLLVLYVSFLIERLWFSSLPQSPLRESPSFFFFSWTHLNTEVKHLHSIFFVMYSSRPSCQLLLVLCSWA